MIYIPAVTARERAQDMNATHRVKTADKNTIGFMIDGVFYTNDYIRRNIEYITNMSLRVNGMPEAEGELPELDYKKDIVDKEYDKLVEENPFVRDIQDELLAWKTDKMHQVLQLEGTRQVGKTTELLKFAYKNYEFVLYVSLAEDNYGFQDIVKNGATPLEFEKYCMRAGLPSFVNNSNTILIIDEIQRSKTIYNAIRLMSRTVKCDIIVTGSYLGRVLQDKGFFLPAGTVSYCTMFPLSFMEFCRIFGAETELKAIDLYGQTDGVAYDRLAELYDLYIKIGGYPEVVKCYIKSMDIGECYNIIGKLMSTFKDESRNYFSSPREVEIFDVVYRQALQEMCNEKRGTGKNTVEMITSLAKANTEQIVNKNKVSAAVVWLKYTGVLGVCSLAVNGDISKIVPDRRMYYADCGIASYLAERYMLDKTALTGLLAETFVYNELHRLFKVPYTRCKVKEDEVCFSVYEQYELDFMVVDKKDVIYGIEVKAKDGNPKSLKVFIDRRFVDRGIVAKPTRGGHGDAFDTIPIFTVGCRFPYEC